jgi:hypothetical protein
VTIFELQGTEEQRRMVEATLARCDFPWPRLLPQLRSESGRDHILIAWADLSAAAVNARAHKLGPDVTSRRRTLGRAWTNGVVEIDYSCAADPELAAEVVLSELAHQVDFHYLTAEHRRAIFAAYHKPGQPAHEHGWFDMGDYSTWVGESFMAGFTRAYSDVQITLTTQFVHVTTDAVARRIRTIITPQQPTPPWDPDPDPPDRPPPSSDPSEPTPILSALGDLLARFAAWLRGWLR